MFRKLLKIANWRPDGHNVEDEEEQCKHNYLHGPRTADQLVWNTDLCPHILWVVNGQARIHWVVVHCWHLQLVSQTVGAVQGWTGLQPKNGPGILAMVVHHNYLHDMQRYMTYQSICFVSAYKEERNHIKNLIHSLTTLFILGHNSHLEMDVKETVLEISFQCYLK